jgi:hypothetical protein
MGCTLASQKSEVDKESKEKFMNRKISKIHCRMAIAAWLIAIGSSVLSMADLGVLRSCPNGDRAYCKDETVRVIWLRLLPALLLIPSAGLVIVKATEEEKNPDVAL